MAFYNLESKRPSVVTEEEYLKYYRPVVAAEKAGGRTDKCRMAGAYPYCQGKTGTDL